MKKTSLLFLCAFLLSACTMEQLFLLPVPMTTPVLTATNTYTPLPTATPVTPTLTFTPTPTLSGVKPPTSIPEDTATPERTVTPFSLITPAFTPFPTIQMEGFVSILASPDTFYKGTKCTPSSVRFTVQVTDPANIKYALLFARFKSLRAERASKWTSIPMQTVGAGTFIHDLSSEQMLEDAFFQSAWVEYQLVGTTQSGVEAGRTDIFKQKMTMLECVPTPTMTPATVKP
ncbi:MAG: hypothetical protein FJ031_05065 [Chloroflexi bacterium]|nr:hypothetical protein [Chloroflexota bacterium]